MAKIIILLQQFVSISNLCLKSYSHIQLNNHHENWLISTNKLHLYVPFELFPHGGQKFATVPPIVGQVVRLGKSTEKTMQAFYEC